VARDPLDYEMNFCRFREKFEAREFQGCMATKRSVLTGIKNGEPHQLVSERWRILEQNHVLADGSPTQSI
jgi:hypothetical protein